MFFIAFLCKISYTAHQYFYEYMYKQNGKTMSDHSAKRKIPVAVLGATGSVGQKFIQLLEDHPWFEIHALAASDRSAGKAYHKAVNWFMDSPLPERIAKTEVQACRPSMDCPLVFSALDASVAGDIEEDFARAGYVVVSNARNHRYDAHVPLLIPEVNPDHLQLLAHQPYGKGKIVTNPNCSTTGMVVALKPLMDAFGLDAVQVVTMQALSGAGYPGVSSLDAMDNVIPFIGGEEEKMEKEPLKILGSPENGRVKSADFRVSASCNRVPVVDGHLESVAVRFKSKFTLSDVIAALREFTPEIQKYGLPSSPRNTIHYFEQDHLPQPRLQRNLEGGMAVSVGRVRECSVLDVKFTVLSHNTVRGAAGGAILNAELLKINGLIH